MVISLRTLIALLSALSVAVVAAITLSITLTTGLAALRDIGRIHATVLTESARDQVSDMFSDATSTLRNLRDVVAARHWDHPSNSASDFSTLDTVHGALFLRSNGTVRGLQTFFRDNTQLLYGDVGTEMYYRVGILASPYNTTFPNSTFTLSFTAWDLHTSQIIPYSDPRIQKLPAYTPFRVSDGLWAQALLPVTSNGTIPVMGIIAVTDSLNGTGVYVSFAMPMRCAGEPNDVYAISFASFDLQFISTFLATMVSTSHSIIVAYDSSGYVIGSSVNDVEPFFQISDTTATSTGTMPGCVLTSNPYFAAYGKIVPRRACRRHLKDFSENGIGTLYTSHKDVFFSAAAHVEMLSAADNNYFVAVSPVTLAFIGMQVSVAMILPETDVIGSVVDGRNVSIVITSVIFVIVATLNACLVTILLGPLSVIARRMLAAAHFEDGTTRDSLSPLTEVRDLQTAYFKMNEELHRMRSFVPQTILAARRIERGHHDSEEPSEPSVPTPSFRQSIDLSGSGLSSGSHDLRSCSNINDVGPMMTPMEGLRQAPVTVLSANLMAFHEVLGERTFHDLAHGMAKVVSVMELSVMQRLGVLTFHGDHFWAVFNSAKPCLMHARRACEAALEVAEALPQMMPLQRSVRIGVATGTCVVGVIGSPNLKTFSTMGSAFSQATRLDAIARRFGLSVMTTEQSLNEAQGMFEYRYVDYPLLPCGRYGRAANSLVAELIRKRPTMVEGGAGNATGETERTQQDWLYDMGAPEYQNAVLQRNRAFELLSRGRVDRAKQIVLAQGAAAGGPRTYADTLNDLLGLDESAFAQAEQRIDLQQVRFTLPPETTPVGGSAVDDSSRGSKMSTSAPEGPDAS